ncbi:restriction endonuclease [Candidatus Saccharibacteria bacterium]|nr:restriction endonuclease [Candidatus Saccharibacteria bacterium]
MDTKTKNEILEKAKAWMRDELAEAHKQNTLKLKNVDEFNINPFLWSYLANYLEGNQNYKSLAKALIYPRVLGSSINTSFGSRTQELITRLFSDTFGSTTPGIDIEFIDKIDKRKKYCQVKAGPNVINHDDVTTIKEHFQALTNLARTNHLSIQHNDLYVCLLYGEEAEKSQFFRKLEKDYTVVMGKDFWHRFTGDEDFYADLIKAFGEVANEIDMKELVDNVVNDLAKDIQSKYSDMFGRSSQ